MVHNTSVKDFSIVGRGHNFARTIKDSIYIRINIPTLNRNICKYNLPHIWDRLLFIIPELTIKDQQEEQKFQVHNNILVPSASRRSIVVDNISCDTKNKAVSIGYRAIEDTESHYK